MPQEIIKNVFRIPIPLPDSPLKTLNSYYIRGKDKSLLIDTGFRQPGCALTLGRGLAALGADLERTDILLTHMHSDHSGLGPTVAGRFADIYIHPADLPWLDERRAGCWAQTHTLYLKAGFGGAELDGLMNDNPAAIYAPEPFDRYRPLENGQRFAVGDYTLVAHATPGHTPGHVCFSLEGTGLFFLGDHVLFDITPNITCWWDMEDALGSYLHHLGEIAALPVTVPLPAHRDAGDLTSRIRALFDHHLARLNEALAAAARSGEEGGTAYDIAGQMTWQIKSRSWLEFPPVQKWFAVGEALSHLEYLRKRDYVLRRERDGAYHYALTAPLAALPPLSGLVRPPG